MVGVILGVSLTNPYSFWCYSDSNWWVVILLSNSVSPKNSRFHITLWKKYYKTLKRNFVWFLCINLHLYLTLPYFTLPYHVTIEFPCDSLTRSPLNHINEITIFRFDQVESIQVVIWDNFSHQQQYHNIFLLQILLPVLLLLLLLIVLKYLRISIIFFKAAYLDKKFFFNFMNLFNSWLLSLSSS